LYFSDQNANVVYEAINPSINANGQTLVINGVQAKDAGAYDIVVSNYCGSVTSSIVNLIVNPDSLQIATVSLPIGTNGFPYSQQLQAVDGQPPYVWSIMSGSLPSGLVLNSNGLISGTPSPTYNASFLVSVTDGASAVAQIPLTLTISPQNASGIQNLIHGFSADAYSYYTNLDGANPQGGVILLGNTLYGTAAYGGIYGNGVLFTVNTNGAGFTTLYNFGTLGNDGATPNGPLVFSGSQLFGTTSQGGDGQNGTIYTIKTDGTGYTNIYSFSSTSPDSTGIYTNQDGSNPMDGLLFYGGKLYGTTSQGGLHGGGTVFSVNTNGTAFFAMHDFTSLDTVSYTNIDGSNPVGGLLLNGKQLYGTTEAGGIYAYGAVFSIATNGTAFTNMYSFTGGSDGAGPSATLIMFGTNLFGTASYGGNFGGGTIFAINTNGTCFTNLYDFNIGGTFSNSVGIYTNSDGQSPLCGLTMSGNKLYGAASSGGFWGNGNIFAINTDGTGFTNLYNFTGGIDGADPNGISAFPNALYGTAYGGGVSGNGTVFTLPLVSNASSLWLSNAFIGGSKTNFTFQLSGPAGSNYVLQVSTNLINWSSVSTSTIPVSGFTNLSNAISNYNRRFYRVHLQ
jgi:uncharacterized repeat protein (TIGR03803 family)